MSYQPSSYAPANYAPQIAAMAVESERASFIRRTYLHLAGAIGALILLEVAVFTLVPAATLDGIFLAMVGSPMSWLLVLGAFMLVSWIAESWARSATSLATQYAGLSLYVVAQGVIFVPLLYIAGRFAPEAIPSAGLITAMIFGGLTAVVLLTKADASWIGKYLAILGLTAMGLIVCSIIFGFTLGLLFAAAMIALASGYIVYHTSNILHHYQTTQYVAAALALFASVALLFWYVLRIMIMLSGRD